jgi:aspartyl-tRNA(Asn)/glutamyl-tRNA(Gln) amidotransferase subunit A
MNDVFTVPASLAGLPALSVPVALPKEVREGMEDSDVKTVGMQVIGQFGDDDAVLQVAEIVEGFQ